LWFYFISAHAPVIWRKSFLIIGSLPSDVQCCGCDSLVLRFCSNLILLDTTDIWCEQHLPHDNIGSFVCNIVLSSLPASPGFSCMMNFLVPSCVITCFPVCQLLQVSFLCVIQGMLYHVLLVYQNSVLYEIFWNCFI
jgi:hypothetical protein